ncbi:MAG: hypothetical protein WAU28_01570 [Candidatus Moraniibacteriota bacterium]
MLERMGLLETDAVSIEQDAGGNGPVVLDASRIAPVDLDEGEFFERFGNAVTLEFVEPEDEGEFGGVILTLPREQLRIGIPVGSFVVLSKLTDETASGTASRCRKSRRDEVNGGF